MAKNKFDIFVYAHWKGMPDPKLMGILCAHYGKGKRSCSFEYDKMWLKSEHLQELDHDIHFFAGTQYANDRESYGMSLDSISDHWGGALMKRRDAEIA